jgi:hypothetical protein
MEVLHEAEEPCPLIAARLPQALHHTNGFGRITNSIALHTCMSKLALTRVEPACCEWCVGKHEEPPDSDDGGHGSFTVDILVRRT